MSQILDTTATGTLSMHEHGDGSGVIVQSTDVSDALRRNEKLRRDGVTKTKDGDHYAASIPLDLLNAWAMKHGVTWQIVAGDDRMLDRFLAEHAHCRIYEGNI